MKTQLLKLANYSIWANLKFIKCLNGQEEKLLLAESRSSFPSIFETCKHIWFGESGWLSRMQNKGWQTPLVDNFQGKPSDLFNAWQITSNEYIQLIESANLDEGIEFTHDEIEYSISRSDIIMTVINHGNYHRGQIVTMLRQAGISEIPKTDYIEWLREQAREEKYD